MLFSFADVWRLSQPQQACSRRRRRRRRLRQFRTRRRLRPPEQSQRRGGSNGPEWLKKLLSQFIFHKTLLLNSVQIWSWKNSSFFNSKYFFFSRIFFYSLSSIVVVVVVVWIFSQFMEKKTENVSRWSWVFSMLSRPKSLRKVYFSFFLNLVGFQSLSEIRRTRNKKIHKTSFCCVIFHIAFLVVAGLGSSPWVGQGLLKVVQSDSC